MQIQAHVTSKVIGFLRMYIYNRAGGSNFSQVRPPQLKFSKKDCAKVLEYNIVFRYLCARSLLILYETSKSVVDETQYKAISYV